MAQSRIRQIGEGDTAEFFDQPPGPAQIHAPQSPMESAAASILFTSLKALSHRAVIALESLFALLTAASVFWLWMSIAASPSIYQIVAVSIYALYALVLDWMILRRRT